ncbi:MAG: hypothetical protein ACRELT_13295, partial [Longimicrobiales bacterium]
MIITRRTIAIYAALLACTATVLEAQDVAGNATETEVRAVVEGYDRALASGDSLTALSLLHPD